MKWRFSHADRNWRLQNWWGEIANRISPKLHLEGWNMISPARSKFQHVRTCSAFKSPVDFFTGSVAVFAVDFFTEQWVYRITVPNQRCSWSVVDDHPRCGLILNRFHASCSTSLVVICSPAEVDNLHDTPRLHPPFVLHIKLAVSPKLAYRAKYLTIC